MRARILLVAVLVVAFVALTTVSATDEMLVDLLWFSSLGYRSVFATAVIARCVIALGVWVAAAVIFYLCASWALSLSVERERLRVVRINSEVGQVRLPDLLRNLGDRVPWRGIILGVAVIMGLMVALGEASNWDVYLKGLYGARFGTLDPAFGRDLGFYVFTLPLLEELRDLALFVIVVAAIIAGAVLWARGAVDFRQAPPRLAPGLVGMFSVLLGLFFLQRAFSYWLARYDLLFDNNGVVFGLSYVDDFVWRPGLLLVVALCLAAAGLCLSNAASGGSQRLIAAVAVVFVPVAVLNGIAPVIERLRVKPDELRLERPYLERNIRMTRQAYKLDLVNVRPFSAAGDLTAASLEHESPTIKNIRLWDPRPLLATYRQLQEIRLYYDFRDVEVDRYWIDGRYSQVMLSARELNTELLPDNARTWVNQRLKFTHGNGIVMSPVNSKDREGLPFFYVNDIPPVSNVGLSITRPEIYYGEEADSYAVVRTSTPEFNYPKGADNVFGYYESDSGIRIAPFWRRLLFSYYLRDINLLFTETIEPRSLILIRRNISDRIGRLAPFLSQDRDPYIVLSGGRLFWMVDCYTSASTYPYSQRSGERLNYIRNSVKVVVDAYSGQTTLYVADPSDPIIQTWQRIFPRLFQPMSAMPPDLLKHIRYPEDMFVVQADIYRTYHMTDPQVFYNREDLWGFPREDYSGEVSPMRPYYVIMRLPGHTGEEFILMLPMVPQGRDNMIAWLGAQCDGAAYGRLIEYAFSKDKLMYGPYQIQARINQSPEISRQLSLWNQMGSRVVLGNLLVIPLDNSLLYVEPLYLRAENGQLPELQRVIAAYHDRVTMGTSLEDTLKSLFSEQPELAAPNAPIVTTTLPAAVAGTAPKPSASPAPADLRAASDHYNRALQALRSGDWNAFGQEMDQLGRTLGEEGTAAK